MVAEDQVEPCPNCGSPDEVRTVTALHSKGIQFVDVRCHECKTLFYRRTTPVGVSAEFDSTSSTLDDSDNDEPLAGVLFNPSTPTPEFERLLGRVLGRPVCAHAATGEAGKTCAARCNRKVTGQALFCADHWGMLPRAMQEQIAVAALERPVDLAAHLEHARRVIAAVVGG